MDWLEPSPTESTQHARSKEAIAALFDGQRTHIRVNTPDGDSIPAYDFDVSGLTPMVECAYPACVPFTTMQAYYLDHGSYPSMIFDVGLLDAAGKPVAAIEVIVSHWLDARKIGRLVASGVACFGIRGERRDTEEYYQAGELSVVQMILPKNFSRVSERGLWRAHAH